MYQIGESKLKGRSAGSYRSGDLRETRPDCASELGDSGPDDGFKKIGRRIIKMTNLILNERAGSALHVRMGDRSAKLHGLLGPCPKPGMVQVLWPYGEVLAVLEAEGRLSCDVTFLKGMNSIHECFSNFLRSSQLLGLAMRRLEQRMETERRQREIHKGEKNWSVDIDIEADYGYLNSTVDVVIHLDSCVFYLKILADGVAKTIPSVFGDPDFLNSGDSMNTLWNDALNHPAKPLAKLFHSTPRDWLETLSASRKKIAGIRDARVHHGALYGIMGRAENGGPFRVVIPQSSIKGERSGDSPGEILVDSVVHSEDTVADLAKSTSGFFSFLDHVVREAVTKHPQFKPTPNEYSKSGYALAFGPSEFLSLILPAV